MKITIVGAAGGEVTGSAYYVQTKPRVVLTHGEDQPRAELARKIRQRFNLPSELPELGETIIL
jgi:predicted metal-dependent RNase